MEREQERRKTERKEGIGGKCSEARAATNNAMIISVVEEAITPLAGDNKACSNGGSQENEYGNAERVRTECGGSS